MTPGAARVKVSPGVFLWRGCLDRAAQDELIADVADRTKHAPFYRPRMPRSGKPFSVEETNFGSHGWFSDESGYRYERVHPVTKLPWPDIPISLVTLWHAVGNYAAAPECCLVNLYRNGARMGLHQDRDEAALEAPVVSISLGDSALFRIGGVSRRDRTVSVTLHSGDVIVFGGESRLAHHGIDRVMAGTSPLIAGGGRINLTLRRVTDPSKK
ncbi:MAG TPA: alpha-ketoglutarate-dependent dioxygenase AlkB [Rhizomicrobium sp.]|nr:alpha-ketoglutarate-dependent dioxygenase AlkB [Rhizomicrobium sp.]